MGGEKAEQTGLPGFSEVPVENTNLGPDGKKIHYRPTGFTKEEMGKLRNKKVKKPPAVVGADEWTNK